MILCWIRLEVRVIDIEMQGKRKGRPKRRLYERSSQGEGTVENEVLD